MLRDALKLVLNDNADLKVKFLEKFQNRGGLTEMLSRIPIYLVGIKDEDTIQELTEAGCMEYVKQQYLTNDKIMK